MSSKHDPTPYNRAHEALKKKMIEDNHLYDEALKLKRLEYRSFWDTYPLVNYFPMETLLENYIFTHSLPTNIALQRQKLRHQPQRKDTCYKHHLRVLLQLKSYKKVNLNKKHYKNTSTTTQNQDDQQQTAQVVLPKQHNLEFCVSKPKLLEHSDLHLHRDRKSVV